MPLLEASQSVRMGLTRQLIRDARQSEACKLLMSIPGVSVVTAKVLVRCEQCNIIDWR